MSAARQADALCQQPSQLHHNQGEKNFINDMNNSIINPRFSCFYMSKCVKSEKACIPVRAYVREHILSHQDFVLQGNDVIT